DDFTVPGHCERRWLARVRAGHSGPLPPGWSHGAQGTGWRQAGGNPRRAPDTVPAGGQSENGQTPRHHAADIDLAHGRRDDRIRPALFDHFIRDGNEPRWNGEAERLGGLEIDDELE